MTSLSRGLRSGSVAVALACVREHRAAVTEHHTAVRTLVSALPGTPSTMARAGGTAIESSYVVVAVSIPPHRTSLIRFADPAMEYQLTCPGPGVDRQYGQSICQKVALQTSGRRDGREGG